ncbi:MAG: pyruvate kinase [Acidobacteriota bacterium]|nr:pyruvate kinase [Acidobacteriota bacterium]
MGGVGRVGDIYSPAMERRAKIVATLGPASSDEATLGELVKAGVDLVRLNLSHGSHAEHAERIARVRRVEAALGRHVPVVADLMGPRYRLGQVPGGKRTLVAGETVTLGANRPGASGVDLPVDDPEFLRHLEAGERMLIDSGLVELRVEAIEGARITARVVNPGEVSTRKGINLPDTNLPFTISEKDRADIAFAVAEGADFIAASYVGEAAHVLAIREAVRQAGGRLPGLPIIAKLERASALEHLEAIIAVSDGVMVARGDLGVEVPLYTVPVLQKKIVAAGRRAGKPVIVATQMLESMIGEPRPTRAEATDVANAVFDGADALMLSGETAVGQHAVAAVATMARIILEAESYGRQNQSGPRPLLRPLADAEARHAFELDMSAQGISDRPGIDLSPDVPDVVSAAAVYAAGELGVTRIVAWSQGGFNARLAARYRPDAPIVALTPNPEVARQLQLVWGVRPLVAPGEVEHLDGVMQTVDRELQKAGLAEPGDRIIVLMGHPIRERPLTNLMRVHQVRSVEEWERTRPASGSGGPP